MSLGAFLDFALACRLIDEESKHLKLSDLESQFSSLLSLKRTTSVSSS